jgi:pyruvate carboxylase subunit A
MRRALMEYVITGITTNIPFHLALLEEPDFVDGRLSTHFVDDHPDVRVRAAAWVERKREIDRTLARDPARVAAIAAAVAVTL